MAKQRVGLLFGGRSGEHEVSIISARAVAKALSHPSNHDRYELYPFYITKARAWLDKASSQSVLDSGIPQNSPQPSPNLWHFPSEVDRVQVWFPVLHGPNGEDGTIQGLLTLMQVPYVGVGVMGSAAGMDKITTKVILEQAGLPQVDYVAVNRSQVWSDPCRYKSLIEHIETHITYPCFVKPANLGSSVGIAKVRSTSELEKALDQAAGYDRRLIVEAMAGSPLREVECAVLGNDFPKASILGEITYDSDFYDYETKYTEGLAQLILRPELPPGITEQIQEMAVQAFQALDGAGLSRVDFFYVPDQEQLFINEVNTLPGFTSTSMYPRLWAETGVPFEALVHQLIELALERHGS